MQYVYGQRTKPVRLLLIENKDQARCIYSFSEQLNSITHQGIYYYLSNLGYDGI